MSKGKGGWVNGHQHSGKWYDLNKRTAVHGEQKRTQHWALRDTSAFSIKSSCGTTSDHLIWPTLHIGGNPLDFKFHEDASCDWPYQRLLKDWGWWGSGSDLLTPSFSVMDTESCFEARLVQILWEAAECLREYPSVLDRWEMMIKDPEWVSSGLLPLTDHNIMRSKAKQ